MKNTDDKRRIWSGRGALIPQYLGEKQAASFLNMSVQWMRKCRANGTGPVWNRFGGSIRYPIADLEKYCEDSIRNFTGEKEG